MIFIKTSKWCNENLNGSPIRWSNFVDEFVELFESKSLAEFKDEFSDSVYMLFCAIHTYTGISLPMIGASPTINKVLTRQNRWKEIFKHEGLQFSSKYLINGSNFNRPEKVKLALELAREDQK